MNVTINGKNAVRISLKYFQIIGECSSTETLVHLIHNRSLFLPSGNLNVPVFFSRKVLGSGLATPFGSPKLADYDLLVWCPCGAASSPVMLEMPGLDVVLRQKVLAVGADNGLCFETWRCALGGTYASFGIKL